MFATPEQTHKHIRDMYLKAYDRSHSHAEELQTGIVNKSMTENSLPKKCFGKMSVLMIADENGDHDVDGDDKTRIGATCHMHARMCMM